MSDIKEIPYIVKDSFAKTQCPHKTTKVASMKCEDCDHHVSRDKEKNIVKCSYPKVAYKWVRVLAVE